MDGEIFIESIINLTMYDVTADTFSTTAGANGFDPMLLVATFGSQAGEPSTGFTGIQMAGLRRPRRTGIVI